MSNTRLDQYRKEVQLIQAILAFVNVTQSERVSRLYSYAYEKRVLSDQDFFEAINWYAKKCIRIAAERSLRASRQCDITKVRFWNSVIIVLTPLLGDHPFYEVNSMRVNLDQFI